MLDAVAVFVVDPAAAVALYEHVNDWPAASVGMMQSRPLTSWWSSTRVTPSRASSPRFVTVIRYQTVAPTATVTRCVNGPPAVAPTTFSTPILTSRRRPVATADDFTGPTWSLETVASFVLVPSATTSWYGHT